MMKSKEKATATKTPLEKLQEQSSNAVSLLRSTIAALCSANADIDVEREKNNKTIEELNATNVSLEELKAGNSKIISNFEKLLG